MTIAQIQDEFIKDGFQFMEHVFNDGSERNCYVRFTKTTYHSAFNPGEERQPDIGWGRYNRQLCWQRAWTWLQEYRANLTPALAVC